jgi:hypothetical protein
MTPEVQSASVTIDSETDSTMAKKPHLDRYQSGTPLDYFQCLDVDTALLYDECLARIIRCTDIDLD